MQARRFAARASRTPAARSRTKATLNYTQESLCYIGSAMGAANSVPVSSKLDAAMALTMRLIIAFSQMLLVAVACGLGRWRQQSRGASVG